PPPPPGAPAIEGYRVLGVLGRGGMGVVYKAEHERLGRLVAIKALKLPDLPADATGPGEEDTAERLRGRFLHEARLLARMDDHENIVRVHDLPRDANGDDYIVMEFVEGVSLGQRLKQTGRLPAPEAARV